MEYTTLGDTGTTVSRICLGCEPFGSPRASWTLDEERSRAIIERAIDLGITFFDTANVYSRGESERILGAALDGYREEIVVATKVYFQMYEDKHNSGGLSRKTIQQELTASLDRLGMDAVDLYQIHRWDDATPMEVTLRALDEEVRRGRVRSLGASTMPAHLFAEARQVCERLGLERFATMQNHYNLLYREEEREMIPCCERHGVGLVPYSPLAKGLLARPHGEVAATERGRAMDDQVRSYLDGGGGTINERVEELAEQHGCSMAQIGLAWLLGKDAVDAPIVGTTKIEHLEEAVEALDISLSRRDVAYLEEPYRPVDPQE